MGLSRHKLLQTLIPLLSALFLMQLANSQLNSTTSFGFDSLLLGPKNLTYEEDAHVSSDAKFIRLTKTNALGQPETQSVGRVLYSKPVQFWKSSPDRQASFETTIRFNILPIDNNPADGIAFFIAPANYSVKRTDSVGGNLGIFNSSGNASGVFAVEFDTYINKDWDPSYPHIGIDIESRVSKKDIKFISTVGQVVANINYNPITKTVIVVAISGWQNFTISYSVDLKSILPQEVKVGISAATASRVAFHDILSWHFTSILV